MAAGEPVKPDSIRHTAMKYRILSILIGLLAALSATAASPNIVFILADDMGYADLQCFGAPDAKTPHIDQLAADGVRFTNTYAMGPECTPSRTSILTGRYPQRVGGMECAIGTGNVGRYDDAIRLAEKHQLGLPADMALLAPSLKEVGYTNVIFGKWHLGYDDHFSPLDQGFDEFAGFLGGNVDYYQHTELSDIDAFVSGRKPIEREGYLTDLITEDALAFLEKRSKSPKKPFFLYLPHAAPHFPFQAPGADPGKPPTAEEWMKGTRADYVKMIERLDWSVGEIVSALKTHGLTGNTIVVFASDHGAMKPGLNTPGRDYKGTLFDGGIRVPIIAKWPDKIKPGTVSKQLGSLMDLTPSFLNAAGAVSTVTAKLDGDDLLAHVAEGKPDYPRTLHWRSRRGDRTWWAIRNDEYKWVKRNDGGTVDEWFFHIQEDPGELQSLLDLNHFPADKKAILEKLRKEHAAWEEDVAPVR